MTIDGSSWTIAASLAVAFIGWLNAIAGWIIARDLRWRSKIDKSLARYARKFDRIENRLHIDLRIDDED